MAEQSYLFDFARTNDFFENFNINFQLSDMYEVTNYDSDTGSYEYKSGTGGNNFELVLIKYGGENISEYLDSESSFSVLDEDIIGSSNMLVQRIGLDWYNRGDGEATIELHGNVTFEIGNEDNIPLRAIVLRDYATKYVMGYSINMKPFSVTNQLVFDDDVIFWDISRFNQ